MNQPVTCGVLPPIDTKGFSFMNQTIGILISLLGAACVAAPANAESPVSCGSDSKKTGQELRVNGSGVVLRAAPSEKSAKLINKKATEIMKTTQYLQLDNTVTVHEECTQGTWSRVRVTEPDWLRDSHIGWVPSNSLRRPAADRAGTMQFTEADFYWSKETAPYKKTIVAGVNKVYRENGRCKKIDPGSVGVSSSKGTRSDPVFFVMCDDGKGGVFNAFFAKSDVEKGRTLAAPARINQQSAIALCEEYAKRQATHPSTVSFSRVLGLAVHEFPNGRTRVTSYFTAKNSFNLELKYDIDCLFNGSGMMDATITERGH